MAEEHEAPDATRPGLRADRSLQDYFAALSRGSASRTLWAAGLAVARFVDGWSLVGTVGDVGIVVDGLKVVAYRAGLLGE